MRRFLVVLLLMIETLATGEANATPVTWTIPNTTLGGSGNSISGTFAFDSDTGLVSSVSVSVTVQGALTVLGYGTYAAGVITFQVASSLPNPPIGNPPAATITNPTPALSNAGGTATIGLNNLVDGQCFGSAGGICNSIANGGSNNGPVTITAPPPAPTVSSVSPLTGTTAGGTSITITGTNLTGTTGVTVGGNACASFTVVSATSVTCVTPAGTAGTVSVVVTTGGGSNAANTLFTYTAAPSAVPSLSEWSQMLLGLFVMTLLGWHINRRHSF